MGILNVNQDSFVRLSSWWEQAGHQPHSSLLIESMDNPGWLLRFEGSLHGEPIDTGFTRSNYDWIELHCSENELVMHGGPVNLNEMVWRFLHAVDAARIVPTGLAPAPRYFHAFGRNDALDLATRITRWFLSMCDYDWEHGDGITLLTTGVASTWKLQIDTDDDAALSSEDIRNLTWSGSGAATEFSKDGTALIGECGRAHLPSMLSQCLEWLEGDASDSHSHRQ